MTETKLPRPLVRLHVPIASSGLVSSSTARPANSIEERYDKVRSYFPPNGLEVNARKEKPSEWHHLTLLRHQCRDIRKKTGMDGDDDDDDDDDSSDSDTDDDYRSKEEKKIAGVRFIPDTSMQSQEESVLSAFWICGTKSLPRSDIERYAESIVSNSKCHNRKRRRATGSLDSADLGHPDITASAVSASTPSHVFVHDDWQVIPMLIQTTTSGMTAVDSWFTREFVVKNLHHSYAVLWIACFESESVSSMVSSVDEEDHVHSRHAWILVFNRKEYLLIKVRWMHQATSYVTVMDQVESYEMETVPYLINQNDFPATPVESRYTFTGLCCSTDGANVYLSTNRHVFRAVFEGKISPINKRSLVQWECVAGNRSIDLQWCDAICDDSSSGASAHGEQFKCYRSVVGTYRFASVNSICDDEIGNRSVFGIIVGMEYYSPWDALLVTDAAGGIRIVDLECGTYAVSTLWIRYPSMRRTFNIDKTQIMPEIHSIFGCHSSHTPNPKKDGGTLFYMVLGSVKPRVCIDPLRPNRRMCGMVPLHVASGTAEIKPYTVIRLNTDQFAYHPTRAQIDQRSANEQVHQFFSNPSTLDRIPSLYSISNESVTGKGIVRFDASRQQRSLWHYPMLSSTPFVVNRRGDVLFIKSIVCSIPTSLRTRTTSSDGELSLITLSVCTSLSHAWMLCVRYSIQCQTQLLTPTRTRCEYWDRQIWNLIWEYVWMPVRHFPLEKSWFWDQTVLTIELRDTPCITTVGDSTLCSDTSHNRKKSLSVANQDRVVDRVVDRSVWSVSAAAVDTRTIPRLRSVSTLRIASTKFQRI